MNTVKDGKKGKTESRTIAYANLWGSFATSSYSHPKCLVGSEWNGDKVEETEIQRRNQTPTKVERYMQKDRYTHNCTIRER